jgi:hypothetical protein
VAVRPDRPSGPVDQPLHLGGRRVTIGIPMQRVRDTCRICGENCKMTAEHVIPKAAGNSQRIWVHNLESLAAELSRGIQFQRGLTRSSLCGRCNSLTGASYVPAFLNWTRQAAEYRDKLKSDSAFLLPFTVHALLVAKELAVMALAMSEGRSIDLPHFLNLRRLVTCPRQHGRTPGFRFLAYFHTGPAAFNGDFFPVSFLKAPTPMVFCQVGLEPLGYLITSDDDRSFAWAERLGLCDISYFFEQPYGLVRNDHLRFRLLRGEFPFRPISK